MPARNEKDWEEIFSHVKKRLKFIFAENIDNASAHALKKSGQFIFTDHLPPNTGN